jgi:hypothetical protein
MSHSLEQSRVIALWIAFGDLGRGMPRFPNRKLALF